MLFLTPPVTEREAEVIGEIEAIRKQLTASLPRLREWPGLPWRAIHARAVQGLSKDAIAAATDDEPEAASSNVWSASSGYRAALTFILHLADAPDFRYDEGIFRALHYMMMGHDPSKNPGRWRQGLISVRRDPSGDFLYRRDTSDDVFYRAPNHTSIPTLIAELIESLNGKDGFPVIIRAAMAHLNLATIHPFVDGNGRMARALHTLVLARDGVSAPAFASMDEYLSVHSIEYEKVLQEVQGGAWRPERDVRPWIRFCLTAHFRQATALLQLTEEYDRLWDELEREILRRGLPERVIPALADTAIGHRLRSAQYQSTVGVSAHEAKRDLKCLVEAGLLVATREKRGRCYLPADPVKAIRERTRDPHTSDVDPFATS